ncbi:MAG: multicopper oxidase domain-containing protein [Armatimonadetes bacterium]|nr:multicopper oxidase domain-containing protein [Armatimonadota bacterium]
MLCLIYLWRAGQAEPPAPASQPAGPAAALAVSRRELIRTGLTAGLGLVGAGAILTRQAEAGHGSANLGYRPSELAGLSHGAPTVVAVERQHPDAMDPMTFLKHFDYGKASRRADGQTLREYRVIAYPKDCEIAKGVVFPAWTFNGTVPGPTIRCTEGERVQIVFNNGDKFPHTIHLHGVHPANMDGVFEQIPPNGRHVYEFTAEQFGVYLYHCHTMPVTKHIAKGLQGTFIIDPPGGRPRANEMVMVMNGFDPDFDEENEFYTVNGIANYYLEHPITIKVGELVRIYLVNLTEFDQINSFHLHGNVFRLYRTGTRLDLYEITDTVILGQGERAILEFAYKQPGRFLFHAHINEFSERGWVGVFEVAA